MSTADCLSPNTWRALSAEYLAETKQNCYVNRHGRDHGTAQSWYELLDHVRENTSFHPGLDARRDKVTTVYAWTLWWEAREDADDIVTSFDDLKHRASYETSPVPLSDLHHDHPIFTREDNLRFRAWHDTGHLAHDKAFDERSELELFALQARELRDAGRHLAAEALFCESVYQLAAAVTLKGYPERQYCRRLGPVGRAVLDSLVGFVS